MKRFLPTAILNQTFEYYFNTKILFCLGWFTGFFVPMYFGNIPLCKERVYGQLLLYIIFEEGFSGIGLI